MSALRTGDRVRDWEGNEGTICIGWLTGAVSIEWDHQPGINEHYVEWDEVEVLPRSSEGGAA